MTNQIVTVEISMYPLINDYESAIIPFIKELKSHNGIVVKTNAMSTYVQGPFSVVWEIIGKAFNHSFESGIPMSNVMKVIPRKLPLNDLWLEF